MGIAAMILVFALTMTMINTTIMEPLGVTVATTTKFPLFQPGMRRETSIMTSKQIVMDVAMKISHHF
jgi:hypothetical protein